MAGVQEAQWPHNRSYSDGSRVGYGPEGGDPSSKKWLAYLHVAGRPCLYNVWSHLGREHLELLIGNLRSVEGHNTR